MTRQHKEQQSGYNFCFYGKCSSVQRLCLTTCGELLRLKSNILYCIVIQIDHFMTGLLADENQLRRLRTSNNKHNAHISVTRLSRTHQQNTNQLLPSSNKIPHSQQPVQTVHTIERRKTNGKLY